MPKHKKKTYVRNVFKLETLLILYFMRYIVQQ